LHEGYFPDQTHHQAELLRMLLAAVLLQLPCSLCTMLACAGARPSKCTSGTRLRLVLLLPLLLLFLLLLLMLMLLLLLLLLLLLGLLLLQRLPLSLVVLRVPLLLLLSCPVFPPLLLLLLRLLLLLHEVDNLFLLQGLLVPLLSQGLLVRLLSQGLVVLEGLTSVVAHSPKPALRVALPQPTPVGPTLVVADSQKLEHPASPHIVPCGVYFVRPPASVASKMNANAPPSSHLAPEWCEQSD
jgi:hypothetical protein